MSLPVTEPSALDTGPADGSQRENSAFLPAIARVACTSAAEPATEEAVALSSPGEGAEESRGRKDRRQGCAPVPTRPTKVGALPA